MKNFIGFKEALELTVSSVPTAGTESLALDRLTGKISSQDVVSRVDCPSVDKLSVDVVDFEFSLDWGFEVEGEEGAGWIGVKIQ